MKPAKNSPAAPVRVELRTTDGVTIVGDWYQGRTGAPAALLLHMMPAVRGSWRPFAEKLVAVGWSALAIDERGHGESTVKAGGRLDYRTMDDEEQRNKIRDVAAAADWLIGRGIPQSRIALVGASIGANLAIAYAADHPEIPAAAALSPGLDYRGITAEDKIRLLGPDQKLLLAASADDERSFAAVRALRLLKPDADLREFLRAGHGTAMFDAEPGLMDELAAWLGRNVK